MGTDLREMHDKMLEAIPSGAVHDSSACPFCATSDLEIANSTGGIVSEEKTYSEADMQSALDKVEALEAQVARLSQAAEDATIDSRITEAKAELESQIADLQSRLDTATLEAEAAKSELEAVTSFLAAEAAAAEEAAAVEARKAERVERVKEAASFPDEYLEQNADRFAAMSEEAFELALEDWKTIAPKREESSELPPAETAMQGNRSVNTNSDINAMRSVLGARNLGVDVRSI